MLHAIFYVFFPQNAYLRFNTPTSVHNLLFHLGIQQWTKQNLRKKARRYHFKFFKGCLPQILLGQFLNTLTNSSSWAYGYFALFILFFQSFWSINLPNEILLNVYKIFPTSMFFLLYFLFLCVVEVDVQSRRVGWCKF